MGISPSEFYDLTLYEYRCMICRFQFEKARQWEHTRRVIHAIIAVNSTKKVDVLEIMPLLTDPSPKEFIPPTQEQRDEIKRKAEERAAVFATMRGNK